MASSFGKVMKEIRTPLNESLRTMAKRLDISAAFLSALEVGKKTIPIDYADKIAKEYKLDKEMRNKIYVAIFETNKAIKLELPSLNKEQRKVSLMFARKISDADPKLIEKLKKALEDEEEN
ncbi:MAG: helix-turn-helix domain-containing protein [bacterium]|jgi:transcriptional regulator with XRE-family HTH domain|nr:helix-turn-helix domain-containing protein [bacterium]